MPSKQPTPSEIAVPPVRLAALLISARSASGYSLDDLEIATKGRFSHLELAQIEAAVRPVTDDDIRYLAKVYGLDLTQVGPPRTVLTIDRSIGTVAVGEDATKGENDERSILVRYLALVYKLRTIEPGSVFHPRDEDVAVLAEALERTVNEIEVHLWNLMNHAKPELRAQHAALRRRSLFPTLGTLFARTSRGGLVMSNQAR
jgi:transcriptional regulator with XRE-family HTH domain